MFKSPDSDVAKGGLGQNGVTVYTAKCVGCKREFEDYLLEGEEPDPTPWCDDCIKTMKP